MQILRTSLILLGTLMGVQLASAVLPAPVDGYTSVAAQGGISEYTLDQNGLQVLLKVDHSAPVVTFMVTYRVGSRNEVTGATGATHLLEHLMFKGTTNFNREKGNNVDQLLERVGARMNATTWLDRTNYFAELGSEHLETVVAIEADRMRNLWLRESDRQPEMTVVRNEFERSENNPIAALDAEINAAAITAHPYHHSTIGWRSDIEGVSIEKLREFYDTFYWPDNATVTLIGDFEPAAALALITKYYGAIPRSPKPIPQIYTTEPEQTYPRRVGVSRAGELGVVGIAYKTPALTHPDYAPLVVLNAILSEGKNSRLYRAITDIGLATSAEGYLGGFRDPSLYTFYISLTPGTEHQTAENAALQAIEKLKTDGVTQAEVDRSIASYLAQTAFGRDGSFAIASEINECIAGGDWKLYFTVSDAVKAVTPADVQRVAQTYLQASQSTTGWFVPITEEAAHASVISGDPHRGQARAEPFGPYYYRPPGEMTAIPAGVSSSAPTSGSTKASVAAQAKTMMIAGIEVVVLTTGIQDVVTIRGSLPAGEAYGPNGNRAIPELVAALLDQGTVQQDKFAIASQLEAVGAKIDFGTDANVATFSAKCLAKDLPLVVTLLSEQLRSPAFSPAELAKVKQRLIGNYRQAAEQPGFRATQAYTAAVYPSDHPNYQPSIDTLAQQIEAVTVVDLKAFHAQYYGPKAMKLIAVGDVDIAVLKREMAQSFKGWTGGVEAPPVLPAKMTDLPASKVVFMADKTSANIIWGQTTGLRYTDPDALALRVGTSIFGSGFTGRLMANVRDKEGLTYGIGANLSGDTFTDGDWRITATFAPQLLEQGIASTQRQLTRWHDAGVTADELADRKDGLVGRFQVGMATTGGMANTILTTLNRGLDLEWIDRYPEEVRNLSLEQVNRAIKTYVNPDELLLIKAGTITPSTE